MLPKNDRSFFKNQVIKYATMKLVKRASFLMYLIFVSVFVDCLEQLVTGDRHDTSDTGHKTH